MIEKPSFISLEQLCNAFQLTKTATAIHVGEAAYIQFANDEMLKIWGKGKDVIGKSLVEALPEIEGQPFVEMLAKAWRDGVTCSGTDTPAELFIDGVLKTYYFDFEYKAVKDNNGKVICVLHSATDVTERYHNRNLIADAQKTVEILNREQSLYEELAASNEEMFAINEELSQSRESLSKMNRELESRVDDRVKAFAESEERFRTMAEGTDVLIAVGNKEGVPYYFNKAWSKLTGISVEKLAESGWLHLVHKDDIDEYKNIHRAALATKSSYTDEFRILGADGAYHWLLKKGTPRFFSDGNFAGYISSCIDISDRKLVETQLQEVHEELASSNEELSAINEELTASVEELEQANAELVISEQRFKNLVLQAPFGICVIRAMDLMVTEVNDDYLTLAGRKREDFQDRTIWESIPEAAQTYAPIMQEVIDSGIPFFAKENELKLLRNGREDVVYVDFVYEPVKNTIGVVTAIMAVVIDVSDKVLARKSIENVEERIRLAVEAAEIGTYEYSYITNTLTTSERFNQIFGFDENPINREQVIHVFHPADVHLSEQSHQTAQKTGKLFYETRLILKDDSIHWVRVQGNVYFDADGKRNKLLGTVLDITEYKKLQQQKDDFISIASHELKTPITSLKASLQLLERMKQNPSPIMPKLIEQSSRSMVKISELVEDLLNVSRMNEGQIQLNKKYFVVSEMINQSCSHIRSEGENELIIDGDLELQVFADENRIEQVVVNFVNNAIKYAPESKEIHLKIEKVDSNVVVSVTDTGTGIAPEKLPHLFDRYFRVDETGAQISGLGLGLYISANIIARHSGKIGVDSELGKGSTFWFSLPL